MNQPADPTKREFDATFRNSRREAAWILTMWAACLLWTITYCSAFAYSPETAADNLVMGLPSWVFWGVAAPWVTAGITSIAFALLAIKDDDLGDESSPKPPATAEEATHDE